MGVGDKRDLILAGVTVAIVVVTLGLGFGLKKATSLPGTNCSIALKYFPFMSDSCYLVRATNVKFCVECQTFLN